MRKTILFIAALSSLVSAAGCRRVVILNFNAPKLGDVDRLFVEGINPIKPQRELTGLGQTIGYYDVSATRIEVRVTACAAGRLLADQQGVHDVVDDEVTIQIEDMIDPNLRNTPSCGGGLARTDSGAGGEMGGAGGSGPGGAGGDTTGGMGGAAAGGSGAGGTGQGGAGVGGAAGTDGGASDTADCGTDTHGPVCEPPSGDAGTVPDPPTISPECMQYCSNARNVCGATLYDSDDSCQRYCALSGWAATGTSANSLECRNMYLVGPSQTNCSSASADGNSICGVPCFNFCAAWIGICHRDPSEASACLSGCAAAGANPACRFPLLQRALYDQRYCDYVKYGSCLSCE